jgi:solute carrier family 26 (sodium-independent sulfate anion transporter), member 11
MGITGVNTRQAAYRVIIDSLKGLPRTKVDAAIGLSSIVLLYAIRFFCARMEKRDVKHQKVWAIVSSLRMTFTMLLYTLISFLVNRNNTGPDSATPFRIVGHIERGFRHAGPPPLNDKDLVMLVLPELPAILIILVIEHIAIAKSFGRKYSYTVVPSQEILAQGASNFLGTFVGGYVCTGSFGASAVLSKAGSSTPISGLVSAGVLILALYALTGVFRYIPMAALAGLIIHAVANLPTPPKTVLKYWRLSPPEFIIWWVGVLVAIFVSLEVSIYITICLSLAVYLVRVARVQGRFISTPQPGVFVYRFPAGLSYPNQAQQLGNLVAYVKSHTRGPASSGGSGVPTWGEAVEPSSVQSNKKEEKTDLPQLRAVVLDCTAVDTIDITSVQGLVDARDALDKHACAGRRKGEEEKCRVQWHFAGLTNPWARKTLARAGFGGAKKGERGGKCEKGTQRDKNRGANNADVEAARHEDHENPSGRSSVEERSGNDSGCENEDPLSRIQTWELERPLFHADLAQAVEGAAAEADRRRGGDSRGV